MLEEFKKGLMDRVKLIEDEIEKGKNNLQVLAGHLAEAVFHLTSVSKKEAQARLDQVQNADLELVPSVDEIPASPEAQGEEIKPEPIQPEPSSD